MEAFILITASAIMLPGPDTMQIIRIGSASRKLGAVCGLGTTIGNLIWGVASLLGLSALVKTYPVVMDVLALAGSAYLLYMVFTLVRGLVAQRGINHTTPATRGLDSPSTALRAGLFTNLSNPKALIFYGALFSQFITPDMSLGFAIFMPAFMLGFGLIFYCGLGYLAGVAGERIARYMWVIDVLAAVIFSLVAIGMIGNVVGLWQLLSTA
ncbi:LysE family translocator [Corynebacterium glucuronolyticum]|uniref:LysE family translocator n=1 Tax=Corynebacterium glucuronolyticum TaxID=39791 RepID=UPI00223C0936|nr:LysE family translocator [Corynebacterium glucuronolyticum]MCT1442198.1 LysE family translocator [Corynebacterium glucuronolyticum]